MWHGWRATLHDGSRRGEVLKRLACLIVLTGFVLAEILLQMTPEEHSHARVDPAEQLVRRDWRRLLHATESQPRQMALWLRKVMPNLESLAEALNMPLPTAESWSQTGALLAYDVRPLLKKHAPTLPESTLLGDYVLACLAEHQLLGQEAAERLQRLAAVGRPMPLANELLASVFLRQGREAEALTVVMRETREFPDALPAREMAVRLALRLQHEAALAELVTDSAWETLPPLLQHQVGVQLGDLGMQWRGLLAHRLETLPTMAVLLTLLAASLWYVLLVQHAGESRGRWVWPLLPLMAGIASIWPTLSIAAWQETASGHGQVWPFPWDLWQLIIGVGLREELCKVALAALFMPWLLWRRAPGRALMVGGFVGLGFALEENLDYYMEADYGDGVALVRLLSANFLHVAMTGLTTHALYDLLRSRFHRVQSFLSTLGTVIVAHALYDYTPPGNTGLESYLPMIILAFIAWQFWDEVDKELPYTRQIISPAAVFLLGTAGVIAVSFVVSAVQTGSREALLSTAGQCLAFLPVTLIYWRQFADGLKTPRR